MASNRDLLTLHLESWHAARKGMETTVAAWILDLNRGMVAADTIPIIITDYYYCC